MAGITVDPRPIVANKSFSMGGKDYQPGDSVDVKKLLPSKVNQLLNQRWLRFGIPIQPKTK